MTEWFWTTSLLTGCLLAAVVLARLDAHWTLLARPIIAILVVTTGLYAGVGVLGYAAGESDAPEQWIATKVPENASKRQS